MRPPNFSYIHVRKAATTAPTEEAGLCRLRMAGRCYQSMQVIEMESSALRDGDIIISVQQWSWLLSNSWWSCTSQNAVDRYRKQRQSEVISTSKFATPHQLSDLYVFLENHNKVASSLLSKAIEPVVQRNSARERVVSKVVVCTIKHGASLDIPIQFFISTEKVSKRLEHNISWTDSWCADWWFVIPFKQ